MAYPLTREERIYLQNQTAIATIPNSGGAATVANSNCCRHTRASLDPVVTTIYRNDKTGQRHRTPGVGGREVGQWSTLMDLAANGAAGVAPDCDPILRGIWGQAPVIVASTSVTYSMANGIPNGFAMYSFRQPSGVAQRVGFGCLVRTATFNFNEQGAATWSAGGQCIWVLDSKRFASSSTAEKGGLTAFPTEPASPVTNGNIVAGFRGSVSIAGQSTLALKGATLNISRNDALVLNNFGELIATGGEGDEMEISLSFMLDDSDQADIQVVKDACFTKSVVDATLAIGVTPGNIWTFSINDLQLEPFSYDEGERRWRVPFGASRAYPSTLTATDICTLAIT